MTPVRFQIGKSVPNLKNAKLEEFSKDCEVVVERRLSTAVKDLMSGSIDKRLEELLSLEELWRPVSLVLLSRAVGNGQEVDSSKNLKKKI